MRRKPALDSAGVGNAWVKTGFWADRTQPKQPGQLQDHPAGRARAACRRSTRPSERPTTCTVAIKIITPKFTQLAEQLDEIFEKGSEGEIALTLRHPNVIRTYQYGHKGREYYIIMEFIDGPNLKQLIDQGSPRVSQHSLRSRSRSLADWPTSTRMDWFTAISARRTSC